MFNNFKVAKFHMGTDAVLSLKATGRTSGLVLKSGASTSWVVPVFSGNISLRYGVAG